MAYRVDHAVAQAVGGEIRRLRGIRQWTLRHLASKAHLDFGHLGKIERGESASLGTYQRLAKTLGVTIGALFSAFEEPSSQHKNGSAFASR